MNERSVMQWRWPWFPPHSRQQVPAGPNEAACVAFECQGDKSPESTTSGFWSGFSRNRPHISADEASSPGESTPRLNVLVPFNFSPSSCAALDCAVRMAQDRKATVTLLHAICLNLSPFGPANPALIKQQMRRAARDGISRLAATLARQKNLPVNYAIRDGKLSAVVEQYLQQNLVDLVIIGDRRSHRSGWFGPRALAEGLVRKALCPVLVIPTND